MSMTFAEAEDALATGNYTTVASIKALIEQVSGAVTGATSQTTYLLNSGLMPDGSESFEALDAIQEAGGGVGVVKSEMGRLVFSANKSNTPLYNALRKAIKLELFLDANYVLDPLDPNFQSKIDALNTRLFEIVG